MTHAIGDSREGATGREQTGVTGRRRMDVIELLIRRLAAGFRWGPDSERGQKRAPGTQSANAIPTPCRLGPVIRTTLTPCWPLYSAGDYPSPQQSQCPKQRATSSTPSSTAVRPASSLLGERWTCRVRQRFCSRHLTPAGFRQGGMQRERSRIHWRRL